MFVGRETNLPKVMTTTLVTHTMIAVPTTNLFLFQMAMLEAPMSFVKSEGQIMTDMRKTIRRKVVMMLK